MADNKVNSGLLEFSEDQKVFVALDAETSEVKKAVTIDGDGVETDIGGGGGDVTVEALSVTENGTYSEEGKAYSPVTVNVADETDVKKVVISLNCNVEAHESNYSVLFGQILDDDTADFLGGFYIDDTTGITGERLQKDALYGEATVITIYLYENCYAILGEESTVVSGDYTISGACEIITDSEGNKLVKVTGDATISTPGSI